MERQGSLSLGFGIGVSSTAEDAPDLMKKQHIQLAIAFGLGVLLKSLQDLYSQTIDHGVVRSSNTRPAQPKVPLERGSKVCHGSAGTAVRGAKCPQPHHTAFCS